MDIIIKQKTRWIPRWIQTKAEQLIGAFEEILQAVVILCGFHLMSLTDKNVGINIARALARALILLCYTMKFLYINRKFRISF